MYDFVQANEFTAQGVGSDHGCRFADVHARRAERTTGKAGIVQDACLWTLLYFTSY